MNDSQIGSALREKIIFIIVIGLFAVLSFQLFKMQILDEPAYEVKSNENSVKKSIIDAPRGVFFDRNFKVIVSNKPSYTIEITPSEYNTELNPLLEKIFKLDKGYIQEVLYEKRRFSKYQPRRIKRDADIQSIAWLEENNGKFPGVKYIVEMQRDYSFGINGSHIFGYTKEISAEQLSLANDVYDIGDYIGSSGIEKTYEVYLRGRNGAQFVLVDSKQRTIGNYLEGTHNTKPIKGFDLILSIDAEAQKAAEEAFNGLKGALVAIEPSTGEVLAFVSAPDFNLSDFTSVTSQDIWTNLRIDEDKPLFNRATMSINPPGSTHKMLSALAALQEGIITTSDYINCSGGYQFGNRFFKCTHVHGKVNVITAIEKSCNTFFYQLILKTGFDKWAEYSSKFGFGSKTGIDISEESPGIQPNSEYYNRVYGQGKWTKGYIVSLGIGQGELSTTPVQLAKYVSLIANNGKTRTPHIVKGFIKSGTNEFTPIEYPEIEVKIDQENFDIVKEGMFKVVQGEGTARNIRIPGLNIAGKTGTAQNPHGKDHAQFIGFAPFENPRIAIAVMVENVGFGSTYAAPIAQKVIKAYLRINGNAAINQNIAAKELKENL
ncbi:MAG: penicillin-binding protein 2 [Bacteroidetes bacterium]|nr:penicillin-binding protein 2 [Bacteroidota bacterium]